VILSRVDRFSPELKQGLPHGAGLRRPFRYPALEKMGAGGAGLPPCPGARGGVVPRPAPRGRDRGAGTEGPGGGGDVLFRVGKHGEAEGCFAAALELLSAGAPSRRVAGLTCKLADAVHWQGQVARAAEAAEAGLAALGEDRSCVEGVKLLEVLMRSS